MADLVGILETPAEVTRSTTGGQLQRSVVVEIVDVVDALLLDESNFCSGSSNRIRLQGDKL